MKEGWRDYMKFPLISPLFIIYTHPFNSCYYI